MFPYFVCISYVASSYLISRQHTPDDVIVDRTWSLFFFASFIFAAIFLLMCNHRNERNTMNTIFHRAQHRRQGDTFVDSHSHMFTFVKMFHEDSSDERSEASCDDAVTLCIGRINVSFDWLNGQ